MFVTYKQTIMVVLLPFKQKIVLKGSWKLRGGPERIARTH